MSVVILTEARRRLDVDTTELPDATLSHFIDVATALVDDWVPTYNRDGSLYDEAIVQMVMKVAEVSGKGTVGMDAAGEYIAPAPSATAGLIQSVWAYIAPLTLTGGAVLG